MMKLKDIIPTMVLDIKLIDLLATMDLDVDAVQIEQNNKYILIVDKNYKYNKDKNKFEIADFWNIERFENNVVESVSSDIVFNKDGGYTVVTKIAINKEEEYVDIYGDGQLYWRVKRG